MLTIRKKYLICLMIFLGIILFAVGCAVGAIVFSAKSENSPIYREETLCWGEADKIVYDENYALDVAISVYKKLYNKEYKKEDFLVSENNSFTRYECWNVRLNKDFNGIIDDSFKGLLIYKKNGAIVVNFGE